MGSAITSVIGACFFGWIFISLSVEIITDGFKVFKIGRKLEGLDHIAGGCVLSIVTMFMFVICVLELT